MTEAVVKYNINDIQAMAQTIVQSGLFPSIKTADAAAGLMMLCQAEGLHPATAMSRYHIVQGRPCMKAEAMLGEFQRRGGKVKFHHLSDEGCKAEFFSPGIVDSVTIEWDVARATKAGLMGKDVWQKYARAMFRSRVISEGVKTADPAATNGVHTPEETEDFAPIEPHKAIAPLTPANVEATVQKAIEASRQADVGTYTAASHRPDEAPPEPTPQQRAEVALEGVSVPSWPPLPYVGDKPPHTQNSGCRLELWSKTVGKGNYVWQIPYPDGKTLKDHIKDAYWFKWGKDKNGAYDHGFCWFKDNMDFEQCRVCAEWIMRLPCPFNPRVTLNESETAKINIFKNGNLAKEYPEPLEAIEQPSSVMPMDEGVQRVGPEEEDEVPF